MPIKVKTIATQFNTCTEPMTSSSLSIQNQMSGIAMAILL